MKKKSDKLPTYPVPFSGGGLHSYPDWYSLPIEAKKAQRKEFGIPDDHYLIGIVARNQPRKNIPTAIRVIKMLKDGYVRCNNCKKMEKISPNLLTFAQN